MKVLITGHTGFVGKALVDYLKDSSIEIIGIAKENGFDLEKEKSSNDLPDSDIIVHLAGRVGVPASWENSESFYRTNYLTTLSIAEYAKKNKIPIILMSSYMYGDPEYLPIDEKHPVNFNNPYAFSKKIAEDVIVSYHKLFGIQAIILRPMNLYGQGMPTENLMGLILTQAKQSSRIEVRDLSPRRDYLYIEDLCRAISLIINKRIEGLEFYNLGFGTSYSVAEIIQAISSLMQKSFEIIETTEKRVNEINDCYADISKFSNNFGWTPTVNLQEGLRRLLYNS